MDFSLRNNHNTIALWDTGATSSCISMEIVRELELTPTGKINVMTPSGSAVRSTYLLNVVLPNNVLVQNLQVSDSEIGSQKIGMLIGMDIITKGDFAVTNNNGKTKFTFSIPSNRNIDFVHELRMQKIINQSHAKKKQKKKKK